MLLLLSCTVVFLILASGLFSAIETGFTACSPARIHKAKDDGDRRAHIAVKLLKMKDKVISTFLILYSLVNTAATTIATSIFIDLYGEENGAIISAIVMSISIIVFAEVLPKGIAVARSDKIVLLTARIASLMMTIMRPVNYGLNLFLLAFCKLFRIQLDSKVSVEEEVKGILEHHRQEGTVYKDDKEMLDSVLDMRNMTVSEIMIHRSQIYSLDVSIPVSEIISKVLSCQFSRIPIWKNNKDNIVGIIHVKALFKALQINKFHMDKIKLSDFSSEPWFIPDNVPVSTQLNEFRSKKLHLAIVVDEYGDLQGIVTLEDVIEEIVGQIDDESDKSVDTIVSKGPNKYIIDGSTTIRDINRELDWELPDDDANTIAGLIMHKLGRLPEQGERIDIFNLNIVIRKKIHNQIKTVAITLKQTDESDA